MTFFRKSHIGSNFLNNCLCIGIVGMAGSTSLEELRADMAVGCLMDIINPVAAINAEQVDDETKVGQLDTHI